MLLWAATPPPSCPQPKFKTVFIEDPSSRPPHPHRYTHTRNNTKHDYVTKPVSLKKDEALWSSKPSPSAPSPPLLNRREKTGCWRSRSTRPSQGCTPPSCWGIRCHRSHPQRRWFPRAWPGLRCCEKTSCCPASSIRCGRGRTLPRSGGRGSHRNRRQQTVCLDRDAV